MGAVLFTVSYQRLRAANPDEKIPQFFGLPTHHPGGLYALRMIAIFLLIGSLFAWSEVLGYWAAGLIFIAAIPSFIVVSRHNREVQA